jgi:hypothetical protein
LLHNGLDLQDNNNNKRCLVSQNYVLSINLLNLKKQKMDKNSNVATCVRAQFANLVIKNRGLEVQTKKKYSSRIKSPEKFQNSCMKYCTIEIVIKN